MQIADRIVCVPLEHLDDVVILGGGPAGTAAAVDGASEGLRTVIVNAMRLVEQAVEFADRELSRLPLRVERGGSHPARRGAGEASGRIYRQVSV